jgi:hypothetical protein
MKTSHWLFWIIICFVFSSIGLASEPDRVILDKTDDAVDAGAIIKRKQGFLAVPIPISDPTVGTGLGAVALYLHPQRGDDTISPGATSALFGMYTDTDSWAVGLAHSDYWSENKYRFTGVLGYGEFNLKYYGIGDNPILAEKPIEYNFKALVFIPKFQFRLFDSRWYVGARYFYLNTFSTFKFSNINPGFPDLDRRTKTAALGLVTSYDTRDSNYYTTRGNWFEFVASKYGDYVGGDFEYSKYTTFFNYYYPIFQNLVLVGRIGGGLAEGHVPFFDLPTLNMRGFSIGRYRDNVAVSAHFEGRWRFYKRWGAVAFVEAGRIADKISNLPHRSTIVSKGFGLRWLAAKAQGINIGIDIAFGPEDTEYYIQIGEAF